MDRGVRTRRPTDPPTYGLADLRTSGLADQSQLFQIRQQRRDLFWRRLSRNRMAVAGGAIVLGMFALALLAPLVARDPGDIDIARRLQSPSWAFPLGTDDLGRDVLARIFYGARISLLVGFVAVGISTLIGIVLGALAGSAVGAWRTAR